MYKELQVPLLELALAEEEVPRRDLVAEAFPIWQIPNGICMREDFSTLS